MARVIDVFGDVQFAPVDSSEWQACRTGDEYGEQTQIRTGVRSSIKLQIGDEQPYTAVLIDSVGKTAISEAYKTGSTKKVGRSLGYGQIRAGVAEGGLKSDFTVATPVATLSKRGTWNFYMFFERGTERFEVGLLDRGLLEVLQSDSGRLRSVLPGERVTQAMRDFLDQAEIDRNVPVPDIFGQGDLEIVYNRIRTDGVGVIGVGDGQEIAIQLSSRMAQDSFANLARQSLGGTFLVLPPPPLPPLFRSEGFFGSGRGDELVQVLIGPGNPLAQRGFARPGKYLFRRAALEHWLAGRK